MSHRDSWRRAFIRRAIGVLTGVAIGAAIGLVVMSLVFSVLFGLYQYRSDKVTGESQRAGQAWARIHKGMSDDTVRALAGSPSAKHGSCWAWGEGWIFDASTVYRLCFVDHSVSSKSRSLYSDD